MKVISTGGTFRIYDDDLKTYDGLPSKTFKLNFNKMVGFYLEETDNIEVKEKIYGNHQQKVGKIMRSFKLFERNLGVILSGDKGIGKSICAKLISQKAIENELPVIIITDPMPGLADYLSKLNQECVVIFDEFDKTFAKADDYNPQNELLTLFDGFDQGKKLFVITCNEIRSLNDFLINRPGRFHYHLRFEYPNASEISEYLQDKLDECYWEEIPKVVSFSAKANINYDCLRAIAFELTLGYKFEEAIQDLNIIKTNDYEPYVMTINFSDGTTYTNKNWKIDLYSDEEESIYKSNVKFIDGNERTFEIYFTPSDTIYDAVKMTNILPGGDCKVEWYDDEDKSSHPDVVSVVFKKKMSKNIHYTL